MLDLTRYKGQRIRIGDDISIMISDVDLDTGRVHLSIHAPRDIAVHREEIYQRIQAEQTGRRRAPGLNSNFERRWER